MLLTDLRETVDLMLRTRKTLAGIASWQIEESVEAKHSHGAMRWLASVMIDGELSGHTLTLKAYPNQFPLTFRVILASDRAIFRLDYAEDEPHTNSFNAPVDIAGTIVSGPHYHSWEDNRRFSTSKSLPSRLLNARQLPTNVRTFENAYRWFCGEVGIADPMPSAYLCYRDQRSCYDQSDTNS